MGLYTSCCSHLKVSQKEAAWSSENGLLLNGEEILHLIPSIEKWFFKSYFERLREELEKK